jgi:hypothetical protein
MAGVDIKVESGDVLAVPADVLVLKYAQALYGVDAAVVRALRTAGGRVSLPKPQSFRLVGSVPAIAATRLLFVGVPPLRDFGYRAIRDFARDALSILAREMPQARHVTLTVHGPGYGLDEVEAFEAEVAGLVDAVRGGDFPRALERITIIECVKRRARRLEEALGDLLPDGAVTQAGVSSRPERIATDEKLRSAGYASDTKAHVFVAMPFKDEMDDVYHYGIQSAVHAAGLLCERADLSSFTGDVLEWVKLRVRSALLVVADLTDANPNVYLEVGFAWGAGVPTVLVVRDADHLKFDVRGQRCLVYRKIKELEDSLTAELRSLKGNG